MRKVLVQALILIFLCGPAFAFQMGPFPWDSGFAPFVTKVYTGVTANPSTATGYAFLSNVSGSIPWSNYYTKTVQVCSSTNNCWTFFAGAAGTGETTGSNALAGWNFTSGWSLFQATVTGASTFTATGTPAVLYNTYLTPGVLYMGSFSGTAQQGTLIFASQGQTATYMQNGASNQHFTAVTNGVVDVVNNSTANGKTVSISILNAYPVFTPSATGIRLTSTRGGANGIASTQGSPDPNSGTFIITVSR